MLSQLPYPRDVFEKSTQLLQAKEAMRLGSILLNLGIPRADLAPAFRVQWERTLALVDAAIEKTGGLEEHPSLRWAVSENPLLGLELPPSLRGLRTVLALGAERIWLEPAYRPTRPIAGPSWADQVEEDEEERALLAGVDLRRPAAEVMRPRPLAVAQPPTHPFTLQAHGRTPPTAVWQPDRPARQPREGGARGGRRGRSLVSGESWLSSSDFSSTEHLQEEDFGWASE